MPLYALGEKRPTLPGRYWIAPNAQVIGDVVLADDVGIWFGAVLRGDNDPLVIGPRSNIQDNSVIHTDTGVGCTIGADVTVGHNVTLHGCTVGDNSLIGMGATVLNGAVIGRNCIVGANALVTEGKVFPDFSLIVGSPAKVVRELPPEVAAQLKRSADHYVANWQRYAAQLKRLD
jgi:carbonic anhydrase/acetyltransferase-like protein (isoleucine patch superfamily)